MTISTPTPVPTLTNKSQLAKLLAREDITVQYSKSVSTALFNSVTRTLTLPVWIDMSNELHEMLVAHEIGHALHTPASEKDLLDAMKTVDPSMSGIGKAYLNVAEDARIEQMVKNEFPGSRKCFAKGYRELLERDFFALDSTPMQDRTLCDRINLQAKIGFLVDVPFSDYEREILDFVMGAKTWEDVINAAKEMWDYDGKNYPNQDAGNSTVSLDDTNENDENSAENGNGPSDASDSSEEDRQDDPADADGTPNADGDSTANEDSDDSDDSTNTPVSDNDGKNDSENSESGTESAKNESSDDAESSSTGQTQGGMSNDIPQAPSSAQAMEDALQKMTDTSGNEDVFGTFPEFSASSIIDWKRIHDEMDSKYAAFNAETKNVMDTAASLFTAENRKQVNLMAREFERRRVAKTHRRNRTGTRGVLDVNRLHSYKFSEDLFKTYTITKDGKSHGIVMFVDWSGSMHGVIGDTLNQMLSMASFCRKVQIPFEVYAFSSVHPDNFNTENFDRYKSDQNPTWDYKAGDVRMNDFALLNLLDSSMSKKEFENAIRNMMILCALIGGPNEFITKAIKNSGYLSNQLNWGYDGKYGLGGTPLNSCIVAAIDLVRNFRQKNSTQVLTTVFLTDGGASDSIHHCTFTNEVDENGNRVWNHSHWGSGLSVRHRSQRIHTNISDAYRHSNRFEGQTNRLLGVLRDATNSRVINFSIMNGEWRRWKKGRNVPYELRNAFVSIHGKMQRGEDETKFIAWIEKGMKDNVLWASNYEGFDEVYFFASGNMSVTGEDGLADLAENATKTRIRNAFLKTASSSRVSRVFLNRVSEQIATSL